MAVKEEIIRIKLDTDDFKKQMVDREKEIRSTKEALKELTVTVKANGQATEEQIKYEIELQAKLRLLNKEQSDAKRTLDNLTKSQVSNADSLDQLKARLALLTREYNQLSGEERENTEAGKALQKEIKGISDKLKEQEKAVGNTTRNVGNYKEGVTEALQASGLFANEIDKLTQIQGTLNGLLKVTKGNQDAANASIAAGGPASAIFAKGMQVVKAALIGTGIGAFIVVIGSLIAFFKRTEEGAEALERGLAQLEGIFDVLIGTVASFGKTLFEAANNPKQAFKDLGEFIKNQVINRFTAMGVILKGIYEGDLKGVSNGFLQVATGVEDTIGKTQRLSKSLGEVAKEAAAAGRAYASITKAAQDLEDEQLAAGPGIERLRGQIDQLLLQAKERTKSEKERLAGLKEAGKIEEQLFSQREGFAKRELEIALRREQLDRQSGKLDRNTRSEEAVAAEIKLQQIQNESLVQRQQIANRESVFIKELNEERIKAQQEALKKQLENEKAAIQLRLLQAAKGSIDELGIREELLQKELEITLKTGDFTKTQRLLAEAETNATILQARKNFFTEIESIDILANQKRAQVEDPILEKFKAQMNASKEAMDQQKEDAKALADYEAQQTQARIQNLYAFTDNLTETFDEQTLVYKAAFKIKQAIATAEAALALPGIFTTNAATGAKISALAPPVTIPLGIAYTVAADIAAAAKVAKMLADIAGIKFGFYDGGFTEKGNPRQEAKNLGTKHYTYHKNEYVMPHDILAMPEGQYLAERAEVLRLQKRGLKAANVTNNSFYTGGNTIPTTTRSAISASQGVDIDYNKLGREMTKIKLYTNITDVKRGLNQADRIEAKVNS